MTSASKGRLQRRAQAKAAVKAYDPSEPAKSIITLTEVPGTGGFTIGLGLHGARMEELFPGVAQPVSVVDVMALALTSMIRKKSTDLEAEVNLTNTMLRNVTERLAAGEGEEAVRELANEALGGALDDIENPSEIEGADAG